MASSNAKPFLILEKCYFWGKFVVFLHLPVSKNLIKTQRKVTKELKQKTKGFGKMQNIVDETHKSSCEEKWVVVQTQNHNTQVSNEGIAEYRYLIGCEK